MALQYLTCHSHREMKSKFLSLLPDWRKQQNRGLGNAVIFFYWKVLDLELMFNWWRFQPTRFCDNEVTVNLGLQETAAAASNNEIPGGITSLVYSEISTKSV